MKLTYEEHRATALSVEDRASWEVLRAQHPALASPILSVSMIELAERLRGNVNIGIVRGPDGPVAMMPYCRQNSTAVPFAGPLSDFQAILVNGPEKICIRETMKGLGLSAIHFNAQLDIQSPLRESFCRQESAPYIDISRGFEAYREERRLAKSDELKEALRKGRKVQRELGEVVFNAKSKDPDVLAKVIRWKSDQLKANAIFDPFQVGWIRQMLEVATAMDSPDCQGMLCSLTIGGELASGALCIRRNEVLHGWVMAFNPDPKYRKFSPGILLLTELLQQAEMLGIKRIDMGRGDEGFKKSLKSGGFNIGEGVVDLVPMRAAVRRSLINVREWLGQSSLKRSVQYWLNRRRYGKPATKGHG